MGGTVWSSLDGEQITLSKEIGEKPIVLIFGNFTCGPFRSQSGNIEKLYHRYQDRAKFFLVYVREAHPSDGWWMMSNQRVGIDLSHLIDQNGRIAFKNGRGPFGFHPRQLEQALLLQLNQ